MIPQPIPLSQALSLRAAKEAAASAPSTTTNPQITAPAFTDYNTGPSSSTTSTNNTPHPTAHGGEHEPMPFFLPASAKVAVKGKGKGNGASSAPKRKHIGNIGSGSGSDSRERKGGDGSGAAPVPKLSVSDSIPL